MQTNTTMPTESIKKEDFLNFIQLGLEEDVKESDHTSQACIPPDARSKARLLIKDAGVIAGVELARMIFEFVDETAVFTPLIADGESVNFGDEVFHVESNTRALLKTERLLLNAMQRMSGIATLSNRFAFEVEDLPVKILDTRKTTPLIRFLEKWAVRIGGCHNYRDGLYDWMMVKDNHIDACGSITAAIRKVNEYLKKNKLDMGITIEVRNLMELNEAMEVGNITRIMLDNFDLPILREAVMIVDGKFETEASGGVTINNIRKIAQTGVDFISVGALTHAAQSMDMSLKVMK